MSYLDSLPKGISLQVFSNDELIFSSSGKWLNPLFELENFLKNNSISKENLSSHDSALGKAAAALTIRLGIKKINTDLLSENAKKYIDEFNKSIKNPAEKIQLNYTALVPKLMCQTENQLENLFDPEQIYFLLRQRAKLISGVSVEVNNLSLKFGNIKNISFSLNPGDRLLIKGENGIGKTTLLKTIAGILPSNDKKILIDNKKNSELEKNLIGYIPQFSDNSTFSLSVEEVVSLGINSKEKNKSSLIKKSLERTSSLNLINRSFSSLSGGEKQKVNLSRCLAQNAKLLLLDEPTASLDLENKKMVIDILHSLSISEIPTIIVVTHDNELNSLRNWKTINLK
jgi:zinc transport system ATP-binding protein